MIIQKVIILFLAMLIVDVNALFYFLKDHKSHYGHEEVDHHHHHHHHHHEEHKHHEHHDHKNHKYQGHKQNEEHKHEHKPQHTHKHHEYDHHQHHHHGYDHKHHEHKHNDHKQHDEHKHHEHHHHHHHHDHKQYEQHHDQKHHKHHEHHHDHHHDHKHHEHHHGHKHQGQPLYEFKYGVRDPNTGDIKNQWEVRKGDDVLGEYSLVEADGTVRTVQYTAGKHTGFNAIVKKEGKAKHPIDPTNRQQQHRPKQGYAVIQETEYEPKNDFAEVDAPRLPYFVPSDLPDNHKPVFSGIDEESNLLALYKRYPVHGMYGRGESGSGYGIGEYLSKRSYDLSKYTEILNENIRNGRSVDPLKAARGSFAIGR